MLTDHSMLLKCCVLMAVFFFMAVFNVMLRVSQIYNYKCVIISSGEVILTFPAIKYVVLCSEAFLCYLLGLRTK